MSELVHVEDRGAYALLRLNRPEKRNAMNSQARSQLRGCLRALESTHKVIVLTGSDTAFCSGMDLKEYPGGAEGAEQRQAAARDWIATLLEIRRHPAIVIAAVNGLALGGGVSLINVADLAIAADEAEIGMPEIGFGMYPAMAGPSSQRMLAPKRAAHLVLTGRRLDGRTAEAWALVNESVPLDQLESAWDRLARQVGAFDAVALAESKRALDTIPLRVAEWAAIMDEGQAINAAIRERSQAQAEGLARFRAGGLNPGQGTTPGSGAGSR